MTDFFRRLCCCFFSGNEGYEPIPDPSSRSIDPAIYLQQSRYLPAYTETYRPAPPRDFPGDRYIAPAWRSDPAKERNFKAWSPQTIILPPKSPDDLQRLAGLTYYQNREILVYGNFQTRDRKLGPTSIYLAPEVTGPWRKSGLIIFNFNMTITKHHTTTADEAHNAQYKGYMISEEARLNNIRYLEQLRQILVDAKRGGIAVAIATRDLDIANVLAYLQAIVTNISPGSNIADYISMVLCSFEAMAENEFIPDKRSQKSGEVQFIYELFLRNHQGPPVPVMYVDHAVEPQHIHWGVMRSGIERKIKLEFNKPLLEYHEGSSAQCSDKYLTDVGTFITRYANPVPNESLPYISPQSGPSTSGARR